jgi:hypothetical protein
MVGIAALGILCTAETNLRAQEPFLELLSPRGGEVWTEGETVRIRWESEGVAAVGIAIAVGGKDRGHLGGGKPVDVETGSFSWTIPGGFVTDFGVRRSDRVRIMLYDVENPSCRRVSKEFSIRGRGESTAGERENLHLHGAEDEFVEALRSYYRAIDRGRYAQAYAALSRCKIVLYDADGSAVAYQPRGRYDTWLQAQKNITSLKVLSVVRVAPQRQARVETERAAVVMGVRTYRVELDLELSRENWTVKPGRNTVFATLVRGTDGRVRILGIGTGP